MSHYTHDDLVLYYYGEGRRRDRIERHLEACPACLAEYQAIATTLALLPPAPVPDRDERYGLEVWQRIRHQLPDREGTRWWRVGSLAAAGAAAVVAAFVAGRMLTYRAAPAPGVAVQAQGGAPERVRLDELRDHLDRSERLLVDLEHDRDADIHDEQAWAGELVDTNRLYREAAVRAGDATTASVLDDLERQLLDIVHAPSKLSPAEIDELHARLDAAALLFKVRVLHDQLRERQGAPASPRKTT